MSWWNQFLVVNWQRTVLGLISLCFLLMLVVEKIPVDYATTRDVDFLIAKSSVRYLHYDFKIDATRPFLTVRVKADLEVLRHTHIVYFVLSDVLQARIVDLKINTYPADFSKEGDLCRVEMPFWYKKGNQLRLELTYEIPVKKVSKEILAEFRADWYPKNVLPESVTARFQLDVPFSMTGIANGALLAMERIHGRKLRYIWAQNHPTTALAVSIGRYERLFRNVRGRIWRFFSLTGNNRRFQENLLDWAIRIDRVYQDKFGGTGPENPTIVLGENSAEEAAFGSLIFLQNQKHASIKDRESAFVTLAHELAHEWWGNQIVPATLSDWWLAEGFANYSVLLAMETLRMDQSGGSLALMPSEQQLVNQWRDDYQHTLINLQHYNIAEMSLAEIGPFDLQRELLYSKGPFVLHMMCYQLGTARFDRYLKEFILRYRGIPVGIGEFTRLGTTLYGAEMVDFFRQWVYSAGWYNLTLRSVRVIPDKKRYRVNIEIANTGQLYLPDRIKLEVRGTSGLWRRSFRLRKVNQVFQVELPEKPLSVSVNPDNNILEATINDNSKEIR